MRRHRRTDPLLLAVLKSATPAPASASPNPLLPLNPTIVSVLHPRHLLHFWPRYRPL